MTKLNAIDHNVHLYCGDATERVQADLCRDVYDYFFRHVICHQHGSRQAIVNFFFQRLYEECQARGIPPVWDDEDLLGQKIVNILNQLNFNEPTRS